MNNCGTCRFSNIRPTGEGMCYCSESDKYCEDVDYHYKPCEEFESLSDSFTSEIWD